MTLWDSTGAVTGEGDLTLTHSGLVIYVWCNVLDTGPGGQLEPVTLSRYAKIGWWTLKNVVVSSAISGLPDGDYMHDLHWIAFLGQKWIAPSTGGYDPSGDDAFHWFLYPGAQAEFWIGQA